MSETIKEAQSRNDGARRVSYKTKAANNAIRINKVSKESTDSVHAQTSGRVVYKLLSGSETTIQLIKSAHVVGYKGDDEDGNPVYEHMRYCSNQSTIWEEDQRPPFKREQISIEDSLIVDTTNRQGKLLAEFLDKHPSNGVIFHKIDPVAKAEKAVSEQELVLEMQLAVREMGTTANGLERLRDIGNALGYKSASQNSDINILKGELYKLIANGGASKFRDASNDKYSRALSLVEKAHANGTISFRNAVVRWANSEDEMMRVPVGKNWQQFVARKLADDITSEMWEEFEVAAKG